MREVRAIVTVYLATLLGGYSNGFSAIAIPDIKAEMAADNGSAYSDLLIPRLEAASEEQLSWFGEIVKLLTSPPSVSSVVAASSVNLGQVLGCLLGGLLAGRWGPRRMMVSAVND